MESNPDWYTQSTRQMGNGAIDGHDDVEILNDCRSVGERVRSIDAAAQIEYVEIPGIFLNLLGTAPLLQAD